MKIYRIKPTAGGTSAVVGREKKILLLIPWTAALVLAACFFVFSGCAGDASGTAAESATESAVTPEKSIQWNSNTLLLYQGQIPDSIPSTLEETSTGEGESICYYNVSLPTLRVFLPADEISTGAAVIICPGGGYSLVACGSGYIVAEALAEHGIAAFVLKYRLPNDQIMVDKTIGSLEDAQQAIKMVRQRADQWGIDPEKVGIMGHSAGGHLAAMAGTHFDEDFISNEEGIDLRPNFIILVSSVISMNEEITHQGSRVNLLGDNPDESLVDYFSGELQVTEDTPPTFIAHAENDTTVSIENAIRFFDALAEYEIPAQLDQYATGGHQFVVDVSSDGWMASLVDWMEVMGITSSE